MYPATALAATVSGGDRVGLGLLTLEIGEAKEVVNVTASTPLVHWATPEVVFDCRFFADGTHQTSCGETTQDACVQHCREAAAQWNDDLGGRFRYVEADAARP